MDGQGQVSPCRFSQSASCRSRSIPSLLQGPRVIMGFHAEHRHRACFDRFLERRRHRRTGLDQRRASSLPIAPNPTIDVEVMAAPPCLWKQPI